MVKSANDILPLKNLNNRKIAVVVMGNENGEKSMFARRCTDYAEATVFDYNRVGSLDALQQKIAKGGFNTVIVCVATPAEAYMNAAKQLASAGGDVIVATMCHPEKLDLVGSLMGSDKVKASLVTYGTTMTDED